MSNEYSCPTKHFLQGHQNTVTRSVLLHYLQLLWTHSLTSQVLASQIWIFMGEEPLQEPAPFCTYCAKTSKRGTVSYDSLSRCGTASVNGRPLDSHQGHSSKTRQLWIIMLLRQDHRRDQALFLSYACKALAQSSSRKALCQQGKAETQALLISSRTCFCWCRLFRLSKHYRLQDTWQQLLKLFRNRKIELKGSPLDSGMCNCLGCTAGTWRECGQRMLRCVSIWSTLDNCRRKSAGHEAREVNVNKTAFHF